MGSASCENGNGVGTCLMCGIIYFIEYGVLLRWGRKYFSFWGGFYLLWDVFSPSKNSLQVVQKLLILGGYVIKS